MVAQGGRHHGVTPGTLFRLSSQIWPPPRRTETCPHSPWMPKPERPSRTLATRCIGVFEWVVRLVKGDPANRLRNPYKRGGQRRRGGILLDAAPLHGLVLAAARS